MKVWKMFFILGLFISSSTLADSATPRASDSSALVTDTPLAVQLPLVSRNGVGYDTPLRWLDAVTTSEPPIPSNWYDRAHSGHGFDFQVFAFDPDAGHDVYFLTFYTYKNDGTPEWYQAVGTLIDGVFVASPQSNGNTLYRVIYTTSPTSILTLSLDTSVTGSVSVDFNQAAQSPACGNVDRSNALQLGVMNWSIGSESGTWCVEPLVSEAAHASPDFNGHWFAPSDSGWGFEVLDVASASGGAPTIVVYLYYPGTNDQPTWATASGTLDTVNNTVTMPLLQVANGTCRGCVPPPHLTATTIGTFTLTFSQAKSGPTPLAGMATVVVSLPTGGVFQRTAIAVKGLSQPTCHYNFDPTQVIAPSTGLSGFFTVYTEDGCPWTAGVYGQDIPWIHAGAQGTGTGLVAYTVLPNTDNPPNPKNGSILVGGRFYHEDFSVVEAGSTSPTAYVAPYQPQGWSDKIVVTNVTGTTTDSSPLYEGDSLYVDWSVINNGYAPTVDTFDTELDVDGVSRNTWSFDPPLNRNQTVEVSDYAIGSLAPGTHTLRLVADSTAVIEPNDRSSNTYTKTITVLPKPALKPNLTPYAPQGWSDKIVVSNVTGTTSDSSPLLSTDTLFVDWAVINNGAASTAARFYSDLYVDGALRASWYDDPPLDPDHYSYITDFSIGSLSNGTHTIQIVADSTATIDESDETDNQYTKTIQVGAPTNAVLTWTIGDQCSNGAQIDYKFFDLSDNLVWPAPPNAYVISYGQSFQSQLSCTSGHQICFGAQSGSLIWGVGLNGTGSCTVSGTCGQGPYTNNLTCGSSGGSSSYANWSCGSSSQCASVMGGYAGTEGPFCSSSSCQNWGNAFIPGAYSCSTTPTYTPTPGGSQCYNYP